MKIFWNETIAFNYIYLKIQSRPTGYFVHKRESETAIQLQREGAVRYFRSMFVTLTITSGVLYQVFKNKKYTFLQLKFLTKTTLKI